MNTHPQLRLRPSAFTLVELLTVIAIIAILMGLLFPAIGIVKEQARKAETKTACTAIVAAVKAYNTEYGKYPVLNNTGTTDLWFGDTRVSAPIDNNVLFSTLRAKVVATGGADYNPRKIVFFEGKDAGNPAAPKGGFAATGSSGSIGGFYDPWGYEYHVLIDANYDNVISNVPHTDFNGPTKGPQTGCVVFSTGKDNIVGSSATSGNYKIGSNTSDDVISWQ